MAIRVGTTEHQTGGIRAASTEFETFAFMETLALDAVEAEHDVVSILITPPSGDQLYHLQWRDQATGTLTGEVSEFAETFYTMQNLTPGTAYEWRVGTLNSGFGSWVAFETLPAIDGEVSVAFRSYSLTVPTASAEGVLNYPELSMSLDVQETGHDRFSAEMESLMVATWPETLPQKLLIDGYSQQLANKLLRSSMDTGPAKQRRRFSAGVMPVTGKLVLDNAELEILKAFYDTTLVGGSLRFIWVDPTDKMNGNVMFRFTSPVTWTAYGADRFSVALQLEILP